MDNVNKTLYIPLYGKAYVSQRGILLRDEMAETIWKKEGFPLKGKAKSKWLAYSMGMRAAVFDRWIEEQRNLLPDAVVLHLGCGMDSRVNRVGTGNNDWYDVDFPDVIAQRKRYFSETEQYRMIPSDLRQNWLEDISGDGSAIVVMEGISMYLTMEELQTLLCRICDHFSSVRILMDTYTVFAAKATKYKNPINTVGVTEVYGFDDPGLPVNGSALKFVGEREMNPPSMIAELPKAEQGIFRRVFAGKLAKRIYRLYEYATDFDKIAERQ